MAVTATYVFEKSIGLILLGTFLATASFFAYSFGDRANSVYFTLSGPDHAYFKLNGDEHETRAFQASINKHMDESFHSDYGHACSPQDDVQALARQHPCDKFQDVYNDEKTSKNKKKQMREAAQMVFAELTSFSMMQTPGGMDVFNAINSSQYDVKNHQQRVSASDVALLNAFKLAANNTVGDYSASNFTQTKYGKEVWDFIGKPLDKQFEHAQSLYKCMLVNAGNTTMDDKKMQKALFPPAAQTGCNIQNASWTSIGRSTDADQTLWADCFGNDTANNVFFNFYSNVAVLVSTDSVEAQCARSNLVSAYTNIPNSPNLIELMPMYSDAGTFFDVMGGTIPLRADVGPTAAGSDAAAVREGSISTHRDLLRMASAFMVLVILAALLSLMLWFGLAESCGMAYDTGSQVLLFAVLIGVVAIFGLLMSNIRDTDMKFLNTQLSPLEAAGQCALPDVAGHKYEDRISKREALFSSGFLIIFAAFSAMVVNVVQVMHNSNKSEAMMQRLLSFCCAVLAVAFFGTVLNMNPKLEDFQKISKDSVTSNVEGCPKHTRFVDQFDDEDRKGLVVYAVIGLVLALISVVYNLLEHFALVVSKFEEGRRGGMFIFATIVVWATSLVMIGLASNKLRKAHIGLHTQAYYHSLHVEDFGDAHQDDIKRIVSDILLGLPIIAMVYFAITIMSMIRSRAALEAAGKRAAKAGMMTEMHGFM